MWWKTTEVYRVKLPNDGIEMLDQNPIIVTANYKFFTTKPEKSRLLVNELTQTFDKHAFLNLKFSTIELPLLSNEISHAITPAELELIILREVKVNEGDIVFIEWEKLTDEILVTSERTAFISPKTTSMKIQNVIKTWFLEEHNLRSILGNLTTTEGQTSRHKSAPPQSHYDVLISVLNPSPELQKINWNVRRATEQYILPFLNAISPLSNFTLKSQWKYQHSFNIPNKQIRDDTPLGRHYALSEENLPLIITSIERNLGSAISNKPPIHLVVYVPPCTTSPLHIYNRNGDRTSKNNVESFLSSEWGGIIIANPPVSSISEYLKEQNRIEFDVNTQDVMQVMLYLLRKIVGIQNDVHISGCSRTNLVTLEPRQWEVDTHIRTGVVHLLTSATLTLKSIVKLLGDIGYIVINDEVGDAINTAFKNIVISKQYLKDGDINQAVIYARKAYHYSEMAFFDPSLLALLYFPDEQKYAIYIPLFLPIMIPVLLSLSSIKNYFYPKENEEKVSDSDDDDNDVDDVDDKPKKE